MVWLLIANCYCTSGPVTAVLPTEYACEQAGAALQRVAAGTVRYGFECAAIALAKGENK